MAITKAKRELLDKKEAARLPYQIEKRDILTLVNAAWEQSFAMVKSNTNAISERGWGPLNYNVLLHPEIQLTMVQTSW